MSIEFLSRTEHIISEFRSGKTLQEIGDKFFITRERVRQILSKNGVCSSEGGASLKSKVKKQKLNAARNEKIFTKFGCTADEYFSVPVKARSAYREQFRNAKVRGISWLFTPKTWYDCWLSSGKFDERGKGKGYCMARKGDIGPYSPENIYFCTIGENFSDAWKNKNWAHKLKHTGRKKKILAPLEKN